MARKRVLFRIDKESGNDRRVDNEDEAIERIAGHLGTTRTAVIDRFIAMGRVETSFSIYEYRFVDDDDIQPLPGTTSFTDAEMDEARDAAREIQRQKNERTKL